MPTFRTAPITGVTATPPPPSGKEPEVLFVGSLSERKGVPELLSAWRELHASGTGGWRLVVAGTGQLGSEVEALARELPDVSALGYVEHGPELFRLYERAAVFVLPSRSEGFPRVLLEAAAHGCALVATRVGGVPEAFEGGYEPVWVEPGRAGALGDSLGRLTAGDWRANGEAARGWFLERFAERDRALEVAAFLMSELPELAG